MSYVEKFKSTIGQMTPIIIIGTISMILLAYVIMIGIDIPIRKWLKNRMKQH